MGSRKKRTKKQLSSDPPKSKTKTVSDVEIESDKLSKKVLEHLPHLAAEIEKSDPKVRIEGVRWEETERTRQPISTGKPRFADHSPDVIDFLRRCTTHQEALEIIDYLEKRGEINKTHAKELRRQLRTQGIRSFGSKKAWGYYEREGSS